MNKRKPSTPSLSYYFIKETKRQLTGEVPERLIGHVLLPVCPESQSDYGDKQQSAFGGKTNKQNGGVREWLKRTVLKTVIPARVS